ncbi:hypothetical protein COCCU_02145 [Corynebacterium occultum]|uniref:DUF3592 domain-containing protein n=1 Tax=Corynebacterium occultum TaxID=2675219 RepID=A0A6B8WIT5_9CORY|nr:DUF3592 domain-containing protein [Corynebacterium occultum]QGU06388.1 hypothetical protein COCCU_02145 [Corynebacterium occultum]
MSEIPTPVEDARPGVRRRLHQLVLALCTLALLGTFGMVAGPFLNDRSIAADQGRALAIVTGVGALRTTVDFQDEEGIYHSPSTGLLYPTGLGEGQRVWVNYAKSDPDLVKVEHREWTLSIIPALSVGFWVLVVTAILWFSVNFFTRPKKVAGKPGTAGSKRSSSPKLL